MALKHGGHGHDLEGIGLTSPGSLTVECPACPHPGRNLADNWAEGGLLMCVYLANHFQLLQKTNRHSIRFLYIVYISVDANFKLKGKECGLKDVELMPGWGPYIEESAYQTFIKDYVDQPMVRIA